MNFTKDRLKGKKIDKSDSHNIGFIFILRFDNNFGRRSFESSYIANMGNFHRKLFYHSFDYDIMYDSVNNSTHYSGNSWDN